MESFSATHTVYDKFVVTNFYKRDYKLKYL